MAAARGLWGCEDSNLWTAILARHGEVLRAHPDSQGRLEALDRWYRVELPAAIQDRAEKHVTLDDLKWLLAWKLVVRGFSRGGRGLGGACPPPMGASSRRGIWAPPGGGPRGMGRGFPQEAGPRCVGVAFSGRRVLAAWARLPRGPSPRGVGRGSLVAAGPHGVVRSLAGRGAAGRGRFRPRLVTSNAPELVLQRSATAFRLLPDLQAALCSTLSKHYMLYLGGGRECATALSRGSTSGVWTPHHVETALWTWVVRQKLCPDLLPNLGPGPATPEGTRPAKKHRTQAD
ncbi:uncharacterized protein LOC131422050 [Diceros bicornis minor]|uniref:uncharacterized protein LOC131422050 n=1 Tax=Diceros bicornis minor TaxID=77932 RepID=UPI0026EE6C49|nr:uncharacterized protein LOC131422050 [Diceros bicornis minor]